MNQARYSQSENICKRNVIVIIKLECVCVCVCVRRRDLARAHAWPQAFRLAEKSVFKVAFLLLFLLFRKVSETAG